jgi:hypothetical protein
MTKLHINTKGGDKITPRKAVDGKTQLKELDHVIITK